MVQSNNQLRTELENQNQIISKYKTETYELNLENQNLREQLSTYNYDKDEEFNKTGSAARELLELRKYCKQLEIQLKYTEFEKMKMSKQFFYMGNKEPIHPIFLETTQSFPALVNLRKKSCERDGGLSRVRSKSKSNLATVRMRIGAPKGIDQQVQNEDEQ